jgi:hypothetical protein
MCVLCVCVCNTGSWHNVCLSRQVSTNPQGLPLMLPTPAVPTGMVPGAVGMVPGAVPPMGMVPGPVVVAPAPAAPLAYPCNKCGATVPYGPPACGCGNPMVHPCSQCAGPVHPGQTACGNCGMADGGGAVTTAVPVQPPVYGATPGAPSYDIEASYAAGGPSAPQAIPYAP